MSEMNVTLKLAAAVEVVKLEVVVVAAAVGMAMAAVDGRVVMVRLEASKEGEKALSGEEVVVGTLYAEVVEGEALS